MNLFAPKRNRYRCNNPAHLHPTPLDVSLCPLRSTWVWGWDVLVLACLVLAGVVAAALLVWWPSLLWRLMTG